MLLKLKSLFFKMSHPPKKLKVNIKKRNVLFDDKESLGKLSQEELIETVIKLRERNYNLINVIKNKEEPFPESRKRFKKQIDFSVAAKRHVFLKFFYLGWDYQGFVTQENGNNTVEDHLFNALKKCALIESRETCNYQKCGRTDKGVSAFSQVVSLDLRSKVSEPTLENIKDEYPYCLMLNRVLPEKIKCYAWAHVSSDMSARFNCSSRTYKYYFPKGDLNIEVMQEGAKFLLGTHDFRNLCKMDVGNGVTEFIRDITYVDIRPCSPLGMETSADYQMFEFVIQGNAFLYQQIRSIMSILFLIGQGKESPDIINHLLDVEENPCKPQYHPANPLPLNLFNVEYKDVVNSWNIDEVALSKIIQLLQNQWTECMTKSTMIKDMIGNLEKCSSSPLTLKKQTESLMVDFKCKTYKPLLSRQKCGCTPLTIPGLQNQQEPSIYLYRELIMITFGNYLELISLK